MTTQSPKPTETASSLRIEKVATRERLEELLDQGLAALYRDVFSEPPWRESFTLPEVKDIFRSYYDGGGIILAATDPKDGTPAAFAVSQPLKTLFNEAGKAGRALAAARNLKEEEMSYFAEDGVAPSWRRRGVSAAMKNMLLEANARAGMKTVLLRTSESSYDQISAVNKAGGVVVEGLSQSVSRKRIDGEMEEDRRAYYLFDLQSPIPAGRVEEAAVLRAKSGDLALVFDSVARDKRESLDAELRRTYPGLGAVAFAEDGAETPPCAETVFRGRLYLAGWS